MDKIEQVEQHPTLFLTQRLAHGTEFNRLGPDLQPAQIRQPDVAQGCLGEPATPAAVQRQNLASHILRVQRQVSDSTGQILKITQASQRY